MNLKTIFLAFATAIASVSVSAQSVPYIERLDRGLVVAKGQADGRYFASWRLLSTDKPGTTFTLLRNGRIYRKGLKGATSVSVEGSADSRWQVVAEQGHKAIDSSRVVLPWSKPYLKYKLQKPEAGPDYDYTANDCSVGDVDGDGQYELFVKWDPSNSKDNSQDGMTGPVFIDCYKLDMEHPDNNTRQLWRISLGPNIRAGAHYTQFMVYDFDGDGRAELICKTAPGSRDGRGQYVNQASDNQEIKKADNHRDWRNSRGRIVGGQEYLTVFDGQDGHAINTIFYEPNRDTGIGGAAEGSFNWNPGSTDRPDNAEKGNRGERYLAAVAFLDGKDKLPAAVFTRGYYSYAFAWAVTFDGKRLHTKWLNESRSPKEYSVTDSKGLKSTFAAPEPTSGSGSGTLYANGNHNLSVADVDGDGRDEVLWGAAALDDNGRILYATGFGHGDAMHLADINPERPGLEVFDVHEKHGPFAWDVHDAATGEILLKGGPAGIDNGRGLAAQIDSSTTESYFWSAGDSSLRSASNGHVASSARLPINFRIYWDGDAQDELLDGVNITKWNPSGRTTLGIFGNVNNPQSTWRRGHLKPDNRQENPANRLGNKTSGLGSQANRPRMHGFQRPSVSFNGFGDPASNNWTKSNPCLQADLFGDWREEVVYRDRQDASVIYIYMSQIPTVIRHTTLMHDHVYRMGIAWQNTAYNQPPHLSAPIKNE